MKHSDQFWDDGTPRSQANAFSLGAAAASSVGSIATSAKRSAASTRTVTRNRQAGRPITLPGSLSKRPNLAPRWSLPVIGREAGQRDADRSARIAKGSLGGHVPREEAGGQA